MDTPAVSYRLSNWHRQALRELGERFARDGLIRHASEANALRHLVERAAEKILEKPPDRG